MQKISFSTATVTAPKVISAGKPSIPLTRQPIVERKTSDPSSSPKGERYPIPSFLSTELNHETTIRYKSLVHPKP